MELARTFRIDAPIDEVWSALSAPSPPCLRGPLLVDRASGRFAAAMEVELGPIAVHCTVRTGSTSRHEVVIYDRDGDTSSMTAVVTGVLIDAGLERTFARIVTRIDGDPHPGPFARAIVDEVAERVADGIATRVSRGLASGSPGERSFADAVGGTAAQYIVADEAVSWLGLPLSGMKRVAPALAAGVAFLTSVIVRRLRPM